MTKSYVSRTTCLNEGAQIDRLARVSAVARPLRTRSHGPDFAKREIGDSDVPEVPDSFGGPSRTRALDPLIKSCETERPSDTNRAHDDQNRADRDSRA
jgi:hypothetical protein